MTELFETKLIDEVPHLLAWVPIGGGKPVKPTLHDLKEIVDIREDMVHFRDLKPATEENAPD